MEIFKGIGIFEIFCAFMMALSFLLMTKERMGFGLGLVVLFITNGITFYVESGYWGILYFLIFWSVLPFFGTALVRFFAKRYPEMELEPGRYRDSYKNLFKKVMQRD